MVNNGFDTEVKYWNFLFAEVFPLEDNDETEAVILPFLSIINYYRNCCLRVELKAINIISIYCRG